MKNIFFITSVFVIITMWSGCKRDEEDTQETEAPESSTPEPETPESPTRKSDALTSTDKPAPKSCSDIKDPTECDDSLLLCHFDSATRMCKVGKKEEPKNCSEIKEPDLCDKSPLNCVYNLVNKQCEEDKIPLPTKCSDILKSDVCVNSALNCQWGPDSHGVEICKDAPTTAPVSQPILNCASIKNDEAACRASLLGCTWDDMNNLCIASSTFTKQSCFQITKEKDCKNFKATSCRWTKFSALKKSFCLPDYVPDDPQLEHQWHLLNNNWKQKYGINAIDAWSITHGDPNVIIGIVDSGFPLFFADFGPKCKNRKIDINQKISPEPLVPPYIYKGFHGLAVAAAGMACSNNKIAGSGVDHKASVRVASLANTPKGQFSTPDINKGIKWLANLDTYKGNPEAQIINLSLGAFADVSQSFGYYGVIKQALAKNIIVVAASGNEAENVVKFTTTFPQVSEPASIAGVISVGATNIKGNAGSFSNWGPFVDIMAPGVNIMVNVKDDPKLKFQNGTSFASPIVSGVVGLMKAVYPGLTPQVAKHILRKTAQLFSCDQICSHEYGAPKTNICKNDMCPASNNNKLWRPLGLVDAYKAVNMAQQGMPQDPIIKPDINWIGIGDKDLIIKDGRFFVGNSGPVDGEISLSPNQNPNLVLAPTVVAANSKARLALSYKTKPAKRESMIVYFDVHEKATKRYIDTFAVVVVLK